MSDAPAAPVPRIAAILLAAGRSTRFTTPAAPEAFKLTATLHGTPLVRLSAERLLATGCCADVWVVLGHREDEVRHALAGLAVRFTVNSRFAEGIGTSIATGVAALRPGTHAVLIALGDQPLIEPEIVHRIVARYRAGEAHVVRPLYRGIPGNPVLFDASHFPALRALEGDAGARTLLGDPAARVTAVNFDFAMPEDFDTPEAILRHGTGVFRAG